MGLFVIVLMSVATVLLIRNMNKRLRRLPDSFPDARDAAREAEIARLDADLARSEGDPSAASGAAERSNADTPAAADEVKGPRAAGSTADDGGPGERAQ